MSSRMGNYDCAQPERSVTGSQILGIRRDVYLPPRRPYGCTIEFLLQPAEFSSIFRRIETSVRSTPVQNAAGCKIQDQGESSEPLCAVLKATPWFPLDLFHLAAHM